MTFYQASPDEKRLPVEPASAIRDGGTPAQTSADVQGPPAYLRPYANAARNSRVALRLVATELKTRWQADLYPQFAPQFVFTAGSRIVVAGMDSWRVLSDSGESVGEDRRAEGDFVLDPGPGLFYFPDPIGRVAAHRLDNGEKAFSISLFFASQFRRDFIERAGKGMIALSVEREMDPHGDSNPTRSVVELQEFGEPLQFSETRRLSSATRVNYLMRDTVHLLAAMHSEILALATDNSVYLAGADLKLKREFTGEFHPLALSMDEQSRIYLIVKSSELWPLTDRGERIFRVALPEGFEPSAPPVVGYDHRVYAISKQRIVAIAPDGKPLWDRAFDAGVSGAVVTADHRLLVTSGSELLALDSSGKPAVLFRAADDRLATPAAPTSAGHIIIAGDRRVYCLEP